MYGFITISLMALLIVVRCYGVHVIMLLFLDEEFLCKYRDLFFSGNDNIDSYLYQRASERWDDIDQREPGLHEVGDCRSDD